MASKRKKVTPPLCRRHSGEPINVFSSKFERCMCLKCAKEQHEHLSDFMPISEGIKLMKKTSKELVDEISILTENVQNVKRDQSKYIQTVRSSDKNIRGQIRTLRDTVNRHLDLIEQKLVYRLKTLVDKSEKLFLNDQHDIQMFESDLRKMKNSISKSLTLASDSEVIANVITEKKKYEQKKNTLKVQRERIPTKVLAFYESFEVLDFIENVKEFGKVELKEENQRLDETDDMFDTSLHLQPLTHRSSHVADPVPSTFPNTSTPLSFTKLDCSIMSKNPTSNSKMQDSQNTHSYEGRKYGMHVLDPHHGGYASRSTNHTQRQGSNKDDDVSGDIKKQYNDVIGVRDERLILGANHNSPCNLSGVAALTNGRIIVCDSKHKCLQMINRQSEVLHQLVFQYKPCDIATISGNTFVVSFNEKDFVSIFTASANALTHKKDISISGRGGSYSVAFCKGKLAVCRRGEIRIVACDDGLLISKIQIEAHFPQIAMSDSGSRIYLSDFVGGKVTCMNELGKRKWEYGKDDFEPCSVAVDLNQLFVADVKGQILILSTYGILVRQIRCLGHLQAICVDPYTGTVFVTQEINRDKIKSRTIKLVTI